MYLENRFRIYTGISITSLIACALFLILLSFGPPQQHIEAFAFTLFTFSLCIVFLVLALILNERMKIYNKILQYVPPDKNHGTQDSYEVVVALSIIVDPTGYVVFIKDPR